MLPKRGDRKSSNEHSGGRLRDRRSEGESSGPSCSITHCSYSPIARAGRIDLQQEHEVRQVCVVKLPFVASSPRTQGGASLPWSPIQRLSMHLSSQGKCWASCMGSIVLPFPGLRFIPSRTKVYADAHAKFTGGHFISPEFSLLMGGGEK